MRNYSLLLILIALFFLGCSSTSKKKKVGKTKSKVTRNQRPDWLTDPESFCKQRKLCAVGEASGHLMAETSARESLSKIFETKIKGGGSGS